LAITLPIDYNLIRKAIVSCMTTGLNLQNGQVIEEMPETQDAPRPKKPYLSYSITTPGAKFGDDGHTLTGVQGSGVTEELIYNVGGNRKMSVSFHSYAINKDDAYNLMAFWQALLETIPIKQTLEKAGIAVWLNGGVADMSQLLNTGYEGRAHMDVVFGINSNITEQVDSIIEVQTTGTVTDDSGNVLPTVSIDATET
jgi:hypothetical protein